MKLSDYRGRSLLLVFLDPDCAACESLMPELVRIHRESPERPLVAISRGDLQRKCRGRPRGARAVIRCTSVAVRRRLLGRLR